MGEGVRGDDLDVLTCEKECASMTTLRVPDSGVVVFWLGGSGGGRGGDEMRRIGELLQQDAHTCAHGIAGQRKKFSVERIASPCTFGQGDKKKIKIVEKKKKKNSQSKCGTWLSRLDADIWPTTDAAAAAEDEASTSLDEIAELWLGRRSSAALEIGTGCCGAPPPLLLLLALFVVVDLLRSS
jgi:hypothetical protein